MFALIFKNKVIQIEENSFPVSKELEWVEYDKNVKVGQEYRDGFVKESSEELKQRLKTNLIASRKKYFELTSWYLEREIDDPGSYPKEIRLKRNLARKEINEIEKTNSLAKLSKYSEVFQ